MLKQTLPKRRILLAWGLSLAFTLNLTAMAADVPVAPAKIKPLSGGISQDIYALTDDIAAAVAQVKANPNDPEAHFLLAVAYSRTPYVEKALVELDKSKRLARKSKEGFALFDRKIAEYEKMHQSAPDDTVLLYRLGFGYYMRGYAIQHRYMKDAAHTPDDYYDKAQATFEYLISLDANDYSARNYLGFLLAERDPQGNFGEAVALWQESLTITEDNPGAYVLLGQAAMTQGNLRQAVEYSAKAVQVRNAWLRAHNIDPAKLKIRL